MTVTKELTAPTPAAPVEMPAAPLLQLPDKPPSPQQQEPKFFSRIKRGKRNDPRRIIIYGPGGIGKCFGRGTPILMHDGSIKMAENIVSGDLVMGPDSMPRCVVGAHSGFGRLFRVLTVKGDDFVCNENHEIIAWETTDKRERVFTPISWLASSNYVRRNTALVRTGVDFEPVDVEHDPYFVGLWIGDGTRDATSVQITKPDPEIIGYLREYAESLGMSLTTTCSGLRQSIVGYRRGESFKPNHLKRFVDTLSVDDEKRIPSEYLINSRENRLRILAGLLDSDGHLISNCFEVSLKSERLARQVDYLARSLGFMVTLRAKVSTIKDRNFSGTYWRMFISGDVDQIPTRVERKMAAPRQQIKNPLRSGFSVEEIEPGEYFGFEVDGDHRLLLGNFTIVHNSTWASMAPSPIFLPTEDGLGNIECDSLPLVREWADVKQAIGDIAESQHSYKTIVIDSLDWLEPIIWNAVCKKHGKDSIEKFGYGDGYKLAVAEWRWLLECMDALRMQRGMTVIMVAHAQIRRFESPETEAYERYQLKLQNAANVSAMATLVEWADEVLFATYEVFTRAEKVSKDENRHIAIGTGNRIIRTTERPGCVAKNRLNLPEKLPLDWREYAKYLPGAGA